MHRNKQCIAGLALLVLLTGCADSATTVDLPAAMIGRWETEAPAYAGRFLDLSATTITIGTGGGTSERATITRVSQTRDDDGLLYTIDYVNGAGEANALSFHFNAEDGGTIRLRNQPEMAWKKAGT